MRTVAELLAIEAQLTPFHKVPHSETHIYTAKSGGLFLPFKNYLHHVCVVCNFVLLFHFVIRVASSTISSCRMSSSVMQDGTPIKM